MQTNTLISRFVCLTLVALCMFQAAPLVHAQIGQGPIGGSSGITNPLGGGADQSITDVLKSVISWMLGLVGFLALIALIIGGTRMIIDFGKEDQVKKAKATITWAVIGLAVVILSYAILNIVTSEILGSGSGSNAVVPGKPYDIGPQGGDPFAN